MLDILLCLRTLQAHAGIPEHKSPREAKFGFGRSGPVRDSRARGVFGLRQRCIGQQYLCLCRRSATYRRPQRRGSAPSSDPTCRQGYSRQRTGGRLGSVCYLKSVGWQECSSTRAGSPHDPPLSADARRSCLRSLDSCEFQHDTRCFRCCASTFDTGKAKALSYSFQTCYARHAVSNGESLVNRAREAQHGDVFARRSESCGKNRLRRCFARRSPP